MKLTKVETTLDRIADRRVAHLARLRVRTFVASHESVAVQAFAFALQVDRDIVGYALIASMRPVSTLAGRLHEFALDPGYEDLLAEMREVFRIDAIHARTDDAPAVKLGHLCLLDPRSVAPIFEVTRGIRVSSEAAVVLLPERDLEKAREIYGGPLGGSEAWGLYRGDELLGVAPVVPQPVPDYVSLDPVIRTGLRRKGYGRILYGTLAGKQKLLGKRVIATMSWENGTAVAFVRALGLELVSEHLLFSRR